MSTREGRAAQLDIPASVRRAVYERDQGTCRYCGAGTGDNGALHHIAYRSEGGEHTPDNLVTVHSLFWPYCHEHIHRNKALWQPILREVVQHDGLYALQLLRWARAAQEAAS